MVYVALAAGLVYSGAGCRGGRPAEEGAVSAKGKPAAAGKFFICVTDVSGSMRRNDPGRYAEQGAQLAVALLGPETSFGAVAFNSRAWILRRLSPLVQREGSGSRRSEPRAAAQKAVSNVPRGGGTSFISPLRLCRHMLGKVAAGSTGAVVFLTDGRSDDSKRLDDELKYFQRRDVPIFTIALGKKADTQLMQEIAGRTGGAFFKAEKGEDLLRAFVAIVGGIEDFFIRRGPFEPATVMPGTRRLIFMIAKEKLEEEAVKDVPRAEIARVMCDGRAPIAESTFRFPTGRKGREGGKRRRGASAVEVVAYDRPREGVWTADARGRISEWLTIQQPPFTFELVPGQPRPRYVDGQTVKLVLRARAAEAFVVLDLDTRMRVQTEVSSETTGRLLAELPMRARPRPPEAPELVFATSMQARLSRPGEEIEVIREGLDPPEAAPPVEEARPEGTPTEEAPEGEAPVEETLTEETPEGEPPVEVTPEGELPADDEAALDELLEPEGLEDEAPAEEAPQAEAEVPAEEAPEGEAPVEEAPTEGVPEAEAPAEEAPEGEAPAEEADDEAALDAILAGEEAGGAEAPAEETPADEGEGPAEEAPGEEAPGEEAPGEEAPGEEAPAEEPATEGAGDEGAADGGGDDAIDWGEINAVPAVPDVAGTLSAAGGLSVSGTGGTEPEGLTEEAPEGEAPKGAEPAGTEPLQDETFTAYFRCLLKWGPGDEWVHERRVAFMVVPPTDFYTVQPEELLFGTVWFDEEPEGQDLVKSITILAHEGQVRANVSAVEEFVLVEPSRPNNRDPAEVTVENGSEEVVAVGLDLSGLGEPPRLGSARGQITVDLVLVDDPAHTAEVRVPVMVRVHEFTGSDPVDFGMHKAGVSLEQRIEHSASPPLPFGYSLSPLSRLLVLRSELLRRVAKERPKPAVKVETVEAPSEEPAEDEPTAEEPAAEEPVAEEAVAPSVELEQPTGEPAAEEAKDIGEAETEEAETEQARIDEPDVQEPEIDESAPKLKFRLEQDLEGWRILGDVPPETLPGSYLGKLTLTFEPPPIEGEFTWPPPRAREVAVRLEVAPPNPVLNVTRPDDEEARALEAIQMEVTEPGWAEFDIRISPKWVAPGAAYAFEATDLVCVFGGVDKYIIPQRFCVRTAPRGDWDGKGVEHGGTYDLVYRVCVLSDLLDGEYRGEVTLGVNVGLPVGEERVVEVTLPVTIQVKIGNVGRPEAPEEPEAPEAIEAPGEEEGAAVEPAAEAEEPGLEELLGVEEPVEEPAEEPEEPAEEPVEQPAEEPTEDAPEGQQGPADEDMDINGLFDEPADQPAPEGEEKPAEEEPREEKPEGEKPEEEQPEEAEEKEPAEEPGLQFFD